MARRDEFGYTKVMLDIGTWDMNSTTDILIPHGLSSSEWKSIRNVGVMLSNDADDVRVTLDSLSISFGSLPSGGLNYVDSTNVALYRVAGGVFDGGLDYTSTPTIDDVTTRGWITFEYIAN